MKKLFILLAAAALLLPLASCKKDPKPSDQDPVEMKPAATAEVAKTVSFASAPEDNKPTYLSGNTIYEMISIEFTESSRYILYRKPVATKAGEGEVEVVTGPYTESNGTYKCTGEFEGSVAVSGDGSNKEVTVTATNAEGQKEETKTTGTVTSTSSSSQGQTNAARTWKVASCVVTISGGVSIEKGFTGCNLQEIATYAANNGVKNLDPAKLKGYSITEIIFTGANSMTISFSNGVSFGGTYTLSGSNISYKLTSGSNEFINTSASGTLEFPKDGQAELSLNTTVKGYSGGIDFTLTEVK